VLAKDRHVPVLADDDQAAPRKVLPEPVKERIQNENVTEKGVLLDEDADRSPSLELVSAQ